MKNVSRRDFLKTGAAAAAATVALPLLSRAWYACREPKREAILRGSSASRTSSAAKSWPTPWPEAATSPTSTSNTP